MKKDFEFKIYFADSSKALRTKKSGEIVETTHRIDGDKHCIHWRGKDRCAKIRNNGDGTYSRINKKGKEVVKWLKLESGKTF